MFTKPRTNAVNEVGFVSSCRRLNGALTRSKKVLVAVVHMRIWNAKYVAAAKSGSPSFLASFLKDAMDNLNAMADSPLPLPLA